MSLSATAPADLDHQSLLVMRALEPRAPGRAAMRCTIAPRVRVWSLGRSVTRSARRITVRQSGVGRSGRAARPRGPDLPLRGFGRSCPTASRTRCGVSFACSFHTSGHASTMKTGNRRSGYRPRARASRRPDGARGRRLHPAFCAERDRRVLGAGHHRQRLTLSSRSVVVPRLARRSAAFALPSARSPPAQRRRWGCPRWL